MEKFLDKQISRREALKYGARAGALAFSALGIYSAGLDTTPSTLPKKISLPDHYIEISKSFKDPVYRAATVIIWGDDQAYGRGGIFRIGNDLHLLTIHHVVDGSLGKPRIWVPGLTDLDLKLDNDGEYFGLKRKDPNVSYKLTGKTANILESATSEGVITPLGFYMETFNSTDKFAIPMPDDIGEKKCYVKYKKIDKKENFLEVDTVSGYTCDAFSGLPTLHVDEDGNLTNLSVGLLSASDPDDKLISPSDVCRNDVHYITPHLRLTAK